jgi:hypothetical protein
LIAFPIASTRKVAFAVGNTKNMSNITDPTTVNLHFSSHK